MLWLVALMRYLTLFAVVSLIAAVAWTNLRQPEVIPAFVPDGPPIESGTPPVVVVAGPDDPERPIDTVPPMSAEVPPSTARTVPLVLDSGTAHEPEDDVAEVAFESDDDPSEPVDVSESDRPDQTVEPDDPAQPDEPVEPETSDADAVPPPVPQLVERATEEPLPPVQRGRQLIGQVTDTAGGAVAGVTILLTDVNGSLPTQVVTADANGIFIATGMQPGRYALAVAPRSVPARIARPVALGLCRVGHEPPGFGAVCVDMHDTTSVTTVDVVLPFSSTVHGRVVGTDGAPAAGALVRAVSRVPRFENVNELVRADADGRFSLRLVPGPYDFHVVAAGEDGAEQLTCSLRVDAEEGSLRVLDAIDFSSLEGLPAIAPEPSAGDVAEADVADVLSPIAATAPVSPGDLAPLPLGGFAAVELVGRVTTRWGEPVQAIAVVCVDGAGVELARGSTDATGTYTLAGVPAGAMTLTIGLVDEADSEGSRWTEVLGVPRSFVMEVPGLAPTADVDDVIVDVDRVFRVDGRINIDASTLAIYQMQLIDRDPALASLSAVRVRRTFIKGLRLTVRQVEERRGDPRQVPVAVPVPIDGDGTFRWSTALPSGDVAFYLEPRSDRMSAVYAGRAVRPVTPAGVTRTQIVIEYPAGDRRD